MRSFRKQRQAEAHHAISAELQQHTGQHHRTCRGSFHVRVGQPRMQREERHFDGEREKERQEEQHLRARLKNELSGRQRLLDRWQIEGARSVVEPDDADEHHDRARHGVENEFHRRVDAALVAPNADEERHGNQHQFPEKKEEEHIERKKNADDADFEHQQHDEKFFHAMLDAVPGSQNRNRRQEGGQQDEKHADAVHAEVVMDRRRRNPFGKLLELVPGRTNGHATQQEQREEEFRDGNNHGNRADELVVVAAEHYERGRADGGKENQHRKEMSAVQHQRTNPQTALPAPGQKKMTARTTIAPATTHTP